MCAATLLAPAVAWGQDCDIGALVDVESQGAVRTGYVFDGPAADGTCSVEFEGLLYYWVEQIPAAALAGGIALEPPVEAPPGGACVAGAAVDVEWQGSWYPGHVLEGPRPDGTCYISYDGYDSSWDEWVDPSRLQALDNRTGSACLRGVAVSIEWNGGWYAGRVLDGPRPDGSCYVTYDGYDSSWDEWVSPDRLQAVGNVAAGLCVPGSAVGIEWNGSWYPGRVLEGPGPDGSCYVGYDGYDSSWDEWVTPDRLRAGG
ncbi:MAG: hypothetical protein R3F55_23180 [Alphaproteobacteria bacterium]